jgi:hypothetical protein
MNIPAREAKRSLHDFKDRVLKQIWEVEPAQFNGYKRSLHTWLGIGLMGRPRLHRKPRQAPGHGPGLQDAAFAGAVAGGDYFQSSRLLACTIA